MCADLHWSSGAGTAAHSPISHYSSDLRGPPLYISPVFDTGSLEDGDASLLAVAWRTSEAPPEAPPEAPRGTEKLVTTARIAPLSYSD